MNLHDSNIEKYNNSGYSYLSKKHMLLELKKQ